MTKIILTMLLASAAMSQPLSADDWVIGDKTYHDVKVVQVEPDQMRVSIAGVLHVANIGEPRQ